MTTVWNQTMVEEGVMADDFMSARVRIRPGLTWHDGKPWTMHDLKFTYDAVASDNPEELANDPTMRSSEYFNHYAREEVIGSGPYRFVSWTLTDRIVVDRWDDFPDAARVAPFKRVIYRPQSDRNLGLLLFKKGELDEYWFTPQQFATQSNDAEFERVGVKGWAPARRIPTTAGATRRSTAGGSSSRSSWRSPRPSPTRSRWPTSTARTCATSASS